MNFRRRFLVHVLPETGEKNTKNMPDTGLLTLEGCMMSPIDTVFQRFPSHSTCIVCLIRDHTCAERESPRDGVGKRPKETKAGRVRK